MFEIYFGKNVKIFSKFAFCCKWPNIEQIIQPSGHTGDVVAYPLSQNIITGSIRYVVVVVVVVVSANRVLHPITHHLLA